MRTTRAESKHSGNTQDGKQTIGLDPLSLPAAPFQAPLPSLSRSRLLNRVISFYHQSFCEDRRAMEYLKTRGITDKSIFGDLRIGFSNGTLLNAVAGEGEVWDALRDIGILNTEGREVFHGCVVFPIFDENSDCVDFYGEKIADEGVNYLYLPGPRRGVFNCQALKRSKSIILTGSVIDALTLYNTGFKDVIPCFGGDGLTEDHLILLARHQIEEAHLCFGANENGREKAERIAKQLRKRKIKVHPVHLPISPASAQRLDINSFFRLTAEAKSIFENLLKGVSLRAVKSEKPTNQREKGYERTDSGFLVRYGERRYEVLGVAREGVKLRATIKAEPSAIGGPQSANLPKPATQFHLDTVDLYSNRSRTSFANACAGLFGEKAEALVEDMSRMIGLCESWKPEGKETMPSPKMSRAEEEEALGFLKDPALLTRVLQDLEAIGLTGEEGNKLMGYIAATSRKLEEPLSILIQSHSAAGKSALQDALLALLPPEDFVKYTRLTRQALFYKEENSLEHKLLAIEEEYGAREASNSIRSLQSSKYLSIAATGKDPMKGRMKTEEYRVKGPVSLMVTTTEVSLDYQTANRFVTLTVDESREMTEKILMKQREQETMEGLLNRVEIEKIIRKHQNAQRLLKSLKVINSYASYLTYPSESLRARRDHKKYLGIIKAIAFLHQYQREIKTIKRDGETISFIEVSLEDIAKANRLAGEVLERSLDELSPPSRLLLQMIRKMVEARWKGSGEYRFTRKDIRDFSRWSDFQVKSHIKQLEDLEYLHSVSGKKGKEYVYELLYPGGGEDGQPFLMGLTTVDELKEKIGEKGGRDP
jgi:DNA primase